MTGRKRAPEGLKARDELARVLGFKDASQLDRMSLANIWKLSRKRKIDPESKSMKALGTPPGGKSTSTSTIYYNKRPLLGPTPLQIRANAIRRFKVALRKRHIDPSLIPKEAIEGLYDAEKKQTPRAALSFPLKAVDSVKFVAEKDGREMLIGESRMTELYSESRHRKGKTKWKTELLMPAKSGMYSWATKISDPTLLSLGFKGGVHRAFRVMSDIDIDNQIRILNRVKKIRLRAKLKK